ncbi:hypothetical protein ACFQX8_08080 [Klenkia terrae]|uniref:hypothetical protein n=1 Tax=Klenkia terrae TaxID=1052259 RepID=UPI0036101E40
MSTTPGLTVRPREDADLPRLLEILQRSHELVGYPVRASVVRADWLALPTELVSAVAVHDGRVVGHVALHPATGPGHDAGSSWPRSAGRRPPGRPPSAWRCCPGWSPTARCAARGWCCSTTRSRRRGRSGGSRCCW